MQCIHRPTFSRNNTAPLLLLAICAYGSQLKGTTAAKGFADQLFERIDITLQHVWRRNLDSDRFMDFLVVAIILQSYRILSGDPSKIASALAAHGGIATMARRFKLFDKTGPCSSNLTAAQVRNCTSPEELDVFWKQWIASETATRCAVTPIWKRPY